MFARTKDKWLGFTAAVLLGVSLWMVMSPVAYSQSVLNMSQAEPINEFAQLAQADGSSGIGRPFTSQEREQILNKFFAARPQVARAVREDSREDRREERTEVLSVASAPSDEETTAQQPARRIAVITLFNYGTGDATRFEVDPASGEVLSEQPLRGRPSASEEERQEAGRIIQADPENARLLEAGGILEGGFIVDCPSGTPPENRCIQMQILTSDRRRIQRLVIVDLTTGTIASSSVPE